MIDEILPIDMRKMKDINELHTQMCNIVQAMVFNINEIRVNHKPKNLDREIRSFLDNDVDDNVMMATVFKMLVAESLC